MQRETLLECYGLAADSLPQHFLPLIINLKLIPTDESAQNAPFPKACRVAGALISPLGFSLRVYLSDSTTGKSCVGQISPSCWETCSHRRSFTSRHSRVCRARLRTRLSVDGGVVRCNCCRLGRVINQSEWRSPDRKLSSSCSRRPERSCAVPAGAKVHNLSPGWPRR